MLRMLCPLLALGAIANAAAAADDLKSLIAPAAELQKFAGDCKFTEGPAYSPRGFLLFSDIPNNRIVRRDDDGRITDYLNPSGQANGLVFDAGGNLYACQGGARRVAKINSVDGKIEPLADSYDGKKLNSPNDLALDGQGGLYFTDPRYGNADNVEQPVMGVYYVNKAGEVRRVIDTLPRPNGILVSPDGKTLIVANPDAREIRAFAITGPGQLADGKVLFTGEQEQDGNGPDGMAHDAEGRIYATYKSIVVLKADGALVGRIPVPEKPANCTFGGKDGRTLFITARTSLYGLAMNVSGAPLANDGPMPAPQVSFVVEATSNTVSIAPPAKTANGIFAPPARTANGIFAPPAKGGNGGVLPSSAPSEASPPLNPPLTGGADAARGVPVRLISFQAAETADVVIEDITLKVPKTWKQQEPSSKLRKAQFQIPAAEGDKEPAELAVFFFGGASGSVAENLKRWNGEFTGDDKDVKVTQGKSPQGSYVFNELQGTFLKPVGPPIAGKKQPTPGYRSLNVILEIENKGAYYLKLTGPDKTVKAAAEDFRRSFGGDAAKEQPYQAP